MEYIIGLISFLLGIASGYFIAYGKEKGKNRALKEDIESLEDQKQQVQIKYTRELEDLKKDNALNIELRKHKYEEKKIQFAKFFTLLDKFHAKSNEIFMERFGPIYSKFMENYLINDESTQNEGIAEFNQSMMGLFGELNQEHLKLTTETNSIRLISSEVLDDHLDQLTAKVGEATNTAQEMLEMMASPEFWANQTILYPLQIKAEEQGREIIFVRDNIRKQMKDELDQI
ncbi:hypothetical protein I6F43_02505 [Pseudoalteromonas sp. NZS71_1]|uniref:hypothetical protein n=1 Tax=unclassified Pseudoalteromonas TaxID=194690 RepID=UPI0013FDA3E7|nr:MULTISPECIES: hypothetical protein [unclassified Pseudoalteromonas]MBG9990746.1 hypothetical protein [Pseudoalteromonas sp. NZS37]MBH0033572.1 hypothetical protein [Pseudoalteromonas sp. NZS71_1]